MKKKILVVFLICCMFLGVASPVMAASTDAPTDSAYPLHYLYRDGGYIIGSNRLTSEVVILTWDSNVNVIYDTDKGVLSFSTDTDETGIISFSYLRNGDWAGSESMTASNTVSKTYYFSNPVEGNILIYDSQGLVFFSPPLLLDLGILKVKMSPLANQVVGMIQTLLPYGISCLALLISLPLLSNLLRRFLN